MWFKKSNKLEKNRQLKIGILYICTGKYKMFWEGFYRSSQKYFCKNSDVHYFVFSDQPINCFNNTNVHFTHQTKLGWPHDTLKRFHIFLQQKEALQKMDYLFYFNANMLFNRRVKEEDILPDYTTTNELAAVIHPCFFDKNTDDFIYERDDRSNAAIKKGSGKKYFQGCLSGGTAKAYLQLCESLRDKIDEDECNEIIALWHDESHLNRYFLDYEPRALNPGFAYPENMKLPFKKVIVQLDKSNYGGHEFLRN